MRPRGGARRWRAIEAAKGMSVRRSITTSHAFTSGVLQCVQPLKRRLGPGACAVLAITLASEARGQLESRVVSLPTSADSAVLHPPKRPRPGARLWSSTDLYLRFFQRSLVPGLPGALVLTETALPVYQYWSVGARGVDGVLNQGGVSLQFSGWGSFQAAPLQGAQRLDGELNAANLTQSFGWGELTLGRQIATGGAARYVRFDGGQLQSREVALGMDWSARLGVYGGFTVLPRWNQRQHYLYAGAVTSELLRDPSVLESTVRARHTVVGANANVAYRSAVRLGLSYHDQRAEGEVARRSLGLELDASPHQRVQVSGRALLDTDSARFADARLFVDVEANEAWLVSLEYLHAKPALLLSQTSVLSVFAQDAFDELGAEVSYRPVTFLTFRASGYGQRFAEQELGGRGQLQVRAQLDEAHRTETQLSYARVVVPEGGYHSLRNSLLQRWTPQWYSSAELFHYFYDAPIRGYRSSVWYALSVGCRLAREWSLNWATSYSQNPYASADLQTTLRLAYRYPGSDVSLGGMP